MQEDQNIEWKETWRDEYLKEICGFANAQGGRLYVGKNDQGETIPLRDVRKLLVDLPNKAEQILGIIVDVNLNTDGDLEYIEINVAPRSFPVNYRGEYYYRSGSANRLLKGDSLTQFLLERTGRRWDSFTVNGVAADDLDEESFDIFRNYAIRTGRMDKADVYIDRIELLDKLGLMSDGLLKRAAVMLFHRHQNRYFSGCCVRMAKFANESDIEYQDEIRGSLFIIADRVIDLLYLKYLKASIRYEKDIRIETYPYPRDAVRELVFNAIVHSNWADNIPVQIRVDNDSLSISNCCILPPGWTPEILLTRHKSRPFNPDIASAFFRAGLIETWGRGISNVRKACAANGNPDPDYTLLGEDLTVTIHVAPSQKAPNAQPLRTTSPYNPSSLQLNLLELVRDDGKRTQLRMAQELKVSRYAVQRALGAMKKNGLISYEATNNRGKWQILELGLSLLHQLRGN